MAFADLYSVAILFDRASAGDSLSLSVYSMIAFGLGWLDWAQVSLETPAPRPGPIAIPTGLIENTGQVETVCLWAPVF